MPEDDPTIPDDVEVVVGIIVRYRLVSVEEDEIIWQK
jgi:hypothetical protein